MNGFAVSGYHVQNLFNQRVHFKFIRLTHPDLSIENLSNLPGLDLLKKSDYMDEHQIKDFFNTTKEKNTPIILIDEDASLTKFWSKQAEDLGFVCICVITDGYKGLS